MKISFLHIVKKIVKNVRAYHKHREIIFCLNLVFSFLSLCSTAIFINDMDKTQLLYIVKSYF
jgi:hypothetical protein